MKMITKISLTASALLFLLAQIFSFYLIYQNQMDKLDVIKENEQKRLERCVRQMHSEISTDTSQKLNNDLLKENLIVLAFRSTMPENSAIYKDERSIYNSSGFEFQHIGEKSADKFAYYPMINTTLNDKNLMVWFQEESLLSDKYMIYYVKDVTDVFGRSKALIWNEIAVSFFLSLGMAFLLNFLIKKITKPLQDTNETQRQLIGNLSHELKTPLTAMKGYSETILKVNITKEQEEKALFYIYSECSRLSRLTEKMMELTKLYEPEYGIVRKELEISVLLESVHQTVSHALKEKDINLLIQVEPGNLKKKLDSDLMTSFLINLVNNAAMASEFHSSITITADEKKIQVKDEGCGIPKEDVDKVRKAFYRVDKSRSCKSGNMGLGLALCEQIAKVHGAELRIESEKDQGTAISFVFDKRQI